MQQQRGFTLIEMMVTLTLLGTLAAAALPLVQRYHQQRNEESLRESLRDIREAIDRFYLASEEGRVEKKVDESGYPPSLNSLVEGVVDKRSPNSAKLYFLRRIPRDPFCDCPGRPDEETWRTRASTSPPEDFNTGKDVYDVSSSSLTPGLNGVPYAQW